MHVRPLLVSLFVAGVALPAAAVPGAEPQKPAALSAAETRKREAVERFLRARLLLIEGEITGALQELKRAVELDPEDGHLRREYADTLRDLQILPEAEQQARKAVELLPTNATANRTLGQVLLATAKDRAGVERAAASLKLANEALPGDPVGALAYGQALIRLDRAKEATVVLSRALEKGRGPAIPLLLAEAFERSGQLKQAEEVYGSLLRQEPENPAVTIGLLRVFERSRQIDKAVPLVQELLRRQPANLGLKTQYGMLLLRARRLDDAASVLEEVLRADPGNRDALRTFGMLQSERLETDKADLTFKKLQELEPDDPEVPFRRALNFIEARRLDEAERVLNDLRATLADKKIGGVEMAQVDGQLAYVSYLRKDYESARRRLLPIAFYDDRVNQQAVNLLLQIARDAEDSAEGARLARKAWDAAKAAAKPAEGAEPGDPEERATEAPALRAALGEFLVKSPKTQDRGEGEKLLAALAGEGRTGALAAADAWQRAERHGEAVRVAKKGLEGSPDDPDLLFRLAASLERDKKIAEAVSAFEKLISLRTDHAPALNYLGYLFADRNENLERSLELIQRAVNLDPSNGAYLDSLGWVYFRLGKLDLAETYLLKAARLAPDDSTVEEHLGDVWEKKGELEKARASWKRALTLKPDDGKRIEEKLRRIDQRSAKR